MNQETQVETIRAEVAPVVARAQSLIIKTPEDYEAAAKGLMIVKGLWKKADDMFVAPWRKQKSDAEANRKKFHELLCAPLEQAEKILKDKQTAWTQEQERIRRAEEDRINRENAERARKEQERIEAAERAQREKEAAARRAEDEARARAAAAKSEEARKAALIEAERAKRQADAAAAKAEAKQEEAEAYVPPPPVTLASVAPVVKGQSYRTIWKARVVEINALIQQASHDTTSVAYSMLTVDDSKLQAFAKATKGAVPVAGVEWYTEQSLASRGA